jgi:hypothetical protein
MMDARSVLGVVATLENAGVPLWSASRPGSTMTSCVIALCDAPIPRDALAALGFIVSLDELPNHFVVRDRCDRRIDFHTVTFDAIGAATQRLQNGTMAPYRAHGFTGSATSPASASPA